MVGVGGMVLAGVGVLGGVRVIVGVGRRMTLKTAAAQRGFELQPAQAQISWSPVWAVSGMMILVLQLPLVSGLNVPKIFPSGLFQ